LELAAIHAQQNNITTCPRASRPQAPRLNETHLSQIFSFMKNIEDQFIICIRRHQDLKLAMNHHI
jgi:hypothetical protein